MALAFLVTVIFLFADGAPVNKGFAECDNILWMHSDNDSEMAPVEGARVDLDSRGAMTITVFSPTTITCAIRAKGQIWKGPITLSRHGQIETRYLKGGLQHAFPK